MAIKILLATTRKKFDGCWITVKIIQFDERMIKSQFDLMTRFLK